MSKESNFNTLVSLMDPSKHIVLDIEKYFNFGWDENLYFITSTGFIHQHNVLHNLMYLKGPVFINLEALSLLQPGVNMFIDKAGVSRPFDNIILLDTLYEFREMLSTDSFEDAKKILMTEGSGKINEFFTEEFINAQERAAGLN